MRTGSNSGSNLSHTQPNPELRCPHACWDQHPAERPGSFWGPGGRRFKSCLPDQPKAPCSSGLRSPGTPSTVNAPPGSRLRARSSERTLSGVGVHLPAQSANLLCEPVQLALLVVGACVLAL